MFLTIDRNNIRFSPFLFLSVSIEVRFIVFDFLLFSQNLPLLSQLRLSRLRRYDLSNFEDEIVLSSCFLNLSDLLFADFKSLIDLIQLVLLLRHVKELSPNFRNSLKLIFFLVVLDGYLLLRPDRLTDQRLVEESKVSLGCHIALLVNAYLYDCV